MSKNNDEQEVIPINDLFNEAIEMIKECDKEFSNDILLLMYDENTHGKK